MTGAKRIPTRLGKEPLIEAIWEMRFSSKVGNVAQLLPGLIYQKFGNDYPNTQRLPIADLPPQLLNTDENFKYAPLIRMEGSPFIVQIGERVVTLSCIAPYVGWTNFKERILALIEMLKNSGLISDPERFSLKYTDIIAVDDPVSLSALEIELKFQTSLIESGPFQCRFEMNENGFINIIQVASPVETINTISPRKEGIMCAVDTIRMHLDGDFWEAIGNQLQQCKDINTRLFFDLLTEETIAKLEPEYI